ncbi:winged helix-turn-helix domain-containing protein [Enterobacter asburiae]|uniref:winged helix-turn-helix domain-containing protein n=1 Tax=Enterobacter asburiae TaxID=61645 RepID=UPI0018C2B6B6|nr:winged helix-turn-helix domain-containing protein [Enterobacter asburiae]MBG0640535.1 winged helix-turn-helix domain-containing protein [Enterobacter asburiae]
MVYLIDMRIKYRTDDGAMWLKDDEDSLIVLTVIMNRLLSYLIEQRTQVVPRDDLLHNVWDLHGLHSSNHTLNKYISELRKRFQTFGVSIECISTIPRIGFMFNGDVDVKIIEEELQDIIPASVPEGDTANTIDSTPKKTRAFFLSGRIFITAVMVLCVIATTIYFMPAGLKPQKNVKIQKKDMPTYFLFNYGQCPVYTTQNNSPALSERKKLLFTELVKEGGISCLNGTTFLYQVSEAYLYGREGRAFISRCTLKDNEYISCLNYYWSGHERRV